MKSFLLNSENKPIVKWGLIPNGVFYEGTIPEGYSLATCPSGNIVILDIDNKNGKNGYEHIPHLVQIELDNTFNYKTKSGGGHCWISYTGDKVLKNTSTELGLDLRVGAKGSNSGGYVRYHYSVDIRQCTHLIKDSSEHLNKWLEKLFS